MFFFYPTRVLSICCAIIQVHASHFPHVFTYKNDGIQFLLSTEQVVVAVAEHGLWTGQELVQELLKGVFPPVLAPGDGGAEGQASEQRSYGPERWCVLS